jgi:hypothetical protein
MIFFSNSRFKHEYIMFSCSCAKISLFKCTEIERKQDIFNYYMLVKVFL